MTLTLGVEEELLLLDATTLELASRAHELVEAGSERIKHELFDCMVEITTPVCRSPEEVLEGLRALRTEVARRAEPLGLVVAASGTHPFSASREQQVVPLPRYRKMEERLGDAVYRQVVCGLHVHVGMPSPEAAYEAFEALLPRLPELLVRSANSPYWEGEETGLRSARAPRLAELPGGGVPPAFAGYDDYRAFVDSGAAGRMWWDARPHPKLPTLEVRIADQPTDVERSAELAAAVGRLAEEALASGRVRYDRERYRAARDLATKAEVPDQEAERQLQVGRTAGVRAVAADLVERSLASA